VVPPDYPAASSALASLLLATIEAWETKVADEVDYTDRSWRIAEALHLLTWLRPHSRSPLGLLLDEETALDQRSPV